LRAFRCYSSGERRRPAASPHSGATISRGKGYQLYLFTADDPSGERWTRHLLEAGGVAAADYKITDFDGNYRPAIP
jgi:hypothetical protein